MMLNSLNNLMRRFRTGSYASISFLIHVLLMTILGGTVLFKAVQKPEAMTVSGTSFLTDTAEAPLAPTEDQLEFEEPSSDLAEQSLDAQDSASSATLSALMTTSTEARFAIPDNVSATPTMGNTFRGTGTGNGTGRGTTGSGGGLGGLRGNTSFFGIKASGERFAFLLDFSQTMVSKGDRNKLMREEAKAAIEKLPDGCEVVLIPWAGGAWLIDQNWDDVKSKWSNTGLFDFQVKAGEKLDQPKWVRLSSGNRRKLLENLASAKNSGGTDWRSPFNYVMEISPSPDVIFFITDGQLSNEDETMRDIGQALSRGKKRPIVNTLIVGDDEYAREPLKKLASRNGGEFREVKDK